MKRTFALLLALTLLLTACANKTTAPTSKQAAEVDGNTLRIGRYHALIPAPLEVFASDDCSVSLGTDQYTIELWALDVSGKTEDEIAHQLESLKPLVDDAVEMETIFADQHPVGYLWTGLDENWEFTSTIQATFSDSSYIYKITTILSDDAVSVSDPWTFLAAFELDSTAP